VQVTDDLLKNGTLRIALFFPPGRFQTASSFKITAMTLKNSRASRAISDSFFSQLYSEFRFVAIFTCGWPDSLRRLLDDQISPAPPWRECLE
jgi:hypothetical protein